MPKSCFSLICKYCSISSYLSYSLLFFSLSPNSFVQFGNLLLVWHKTGLSGVCAALFHRHIAFLTLPLADVWVVGAFGWLGVYVVGVFDKGAAIST
jgi:hypothetical protein